MFKNSVGSTWGPLVVPVPWLVAGGRGDGWCGALRIVESGEICMHCVAHFCLHAAVHDCLCMLMGQMMMPNKGRIDLTMLRWPVAE